MNEPVPVTRRRLLRWVGWFAAANIGLFLLVGLRYLFVYPFNDDLLGNLYLPLAYAGQMALLASLPLGLVLIPLLLVWPRRGPVTVLGVLIASLALSLLVLDTNVFTANRFHLSLLSASLFEWPTWTLAGIVLLILLVFESLLAGGVWRNFATAPEGRGGGWLAAVLVLSWLGGTGLHIWGDAVGHTPITQFTRYMPLYFPIHAKRDLAKLGWVDPEQAQRRRQLQGGLGPGEGQLNYPLEPMRCALPGDAPKNVIVVLIDALRPDVISDELTPNLARFRDSGQDFPLHFSGGNSSRMGFFSFFYGLPSTYWRSFYDLQQPPVLMQQLRAADFELSLHSASGFGSPTLVDRTVFAGIPGLPTGKGPGGAIALNEAVTDSWLAWLGDHDPARRLFGFIYYDPPIAAPPADSGDALPGDERFQANPDAADAWRRYRLAMRMIDAEIGKLVASVRDTGLADETVLMIASDHGYEFDDNGYGYIGHASSFAAAQLQSVLMMHWPGREPQRYDHRTAHEDVIVTLMQDVFGCDNPPGDYALGRNLFAGESWDWIMAGSYTSHAIVEPEQVTISYPGGFVEMRGDGYQPIDRSNMDPAVVQASMAAMRRFFR
jgi:membrane-anchored protein YejM (alkaline phosphatase superfamily)